MEVWMHTCTWAVIHIKTTPSVIILFRSTGAKHNKLLEFSFKPPPAKKSKLKQDDNDLDEEVDEGEGSDWRRHFNGLWQHQPHDFIVEQAFNQLMSRGGSQCCICSMFELPNPFTTYRYSQLRSTTKCLKAHETTAKRDLGSKSLKVHERERERERLMFLCLQVVVQRAAVQLPLSLAHLAQETLDDDDDEGSELLTCDKCRITVHQCEWVWPVTMVTIYFL